ncbi:MAG: protein kinase [Anaerolineae bacterium]|nr:protein kinase [Anaerolineae bacterium]
MANRNEDASQSKREPSLDTRKIRGLSTRLRLGSSGEPEESPGQQISSESPSSSPAPAPEPGKTRAVGDFSRSEIATRQVRRFDSLGVSRHVSSSGPVEGLLIEGTQLQNRYKILNVVGVGGMSTVYRAQDLRFAHVQRLCAVKEMINTAVDPRVQQMVVRNFEREASILATLSHPAVPQVYDYFSEGARSYLVMEYVDGKNLEAMLADLEGFLSETQVIDWAVQICEVLAYLHNHEPRPIVFRDIKPSNIMVDESGRIRLVDFGIAKLFQSGSKGTMIGTEGYSPPEQYRGVAEPRGDVYALGATLHHLLSKQDPRLEPPFSFHERPIHQTNPTVSRELVEVLDKALEYDINKRWGSAEELKRAMLSLPTARGLGGRRQSETVAFSTDGVKPLWRFACEDEIRASVAVSGSMIFVPSYDHNVYALEADSGKFVWKYPAQGGIASTPWVANELVIFGSIDSEVYAVEKRTGRLVWTMPTRGKIFSSPYGEFGHVFIGSDDGYLYAVHMGGGGRPGGTRQTARCAHDLCCMTT